MSAACASLASLSSYATLGGLTVHALAWPRLRLGNDYHCGCILPKDMQLKCMAEILEQEQFSGIKSLNLRSEDESIARSCRGYIHGVFSKRRTATVPRR